MNGSARVIVSAGAVALVVLFYDNGRWLAGLTAGYLLWVILTEWGRESRGG